MEPSLRITIAHIRGNMKTGIVITTYNRPEYLKKTFDSLAKSLFPKETEIYIIDDCSTEETKQLIKNFSLPNVKITKKENAKNQGMFYGLRLGFEYFYANNFDLFTNLDSDAVVKPFWLSILFHLYKRFPNTIISGFHTSNHGVTETFPQYYTKKDIGGINIFFDRNLYEVVHSSLSSNQWDWNICDKMQALNKLFVVSKPSVVQHIAIESAAGHKTLHPDRADDWEEIKCVSTKFTKVKNIMFVHATRGRPEQSTQAARRMIGDMQSGIPFKYYFSLDADDPCLEQYKTLIKQLGFVTDIIVDNNQGCVDATNRGASKYNGEDLVIVNADDIITKIAGWDLNVLDFIEKNVHTQEYLVHFPETKKDCAIYQILSGALYRKLGYIFYPKYVSMYADNDLWATTTALGACYNYTAPYPSLFHHDHPGENFDKWDDTYKRTNRPICYEIGSKIYEERKRKKFPIN